MLEINKNIKTMMINLNQAKISVNLIIFCLTIILFIGAIKLKCEEDIMYPEQIKEVLSKLDSLDEYSQMKLLSNIDAQRTNILGILLTELGTTTSKKVQTGCIYLIGALRFSDGVNELINRIDFDVGERNHEIHREPLWERYPAMEALIKIGKPSVQPILNLLSQEKDELRIDLAIKVLRYVEGPEMSMILLENYYKSSKNIEKRNILKKAILKLKQLIKQTQ